MLYLSRKRIAVAVMFALNAASQSIPVQAQEEAQSSPAPQLIAQSADALPEVTVTATRKETAVDQVPATITVIDQQTIQRKIGADEADLFKDQPDVTFARDLRRFGATRLNIRGLEDNRIIQMVDGVRLPDVYDSGGPTNFTFSGPLTVSQDFLKQVEILRGSASTLYGSDALGGVVGYVTLDPQDIIKAGNDHGAVYRFGFTGENDGVTNSILGAWRGDKVELMLGYSHTQANQLDNRGNDGGTSRFRSKPNPQDITDDGAIAKVIVHPVDDHKVTLTLEGRNQEAEVDVKRLTSNLPRVTAMTGEDESDRWRASVEWQHTPQNRFYDALNLKLFRQVAQTSNDNLQTRSNTTATCSAVTAGINQCLIDQGFDMTQESYGANILFNSATTLFQQNHLFTYGLDFSRLKTTEIRDLTRYNLTTGTVSNTLAGDTYPVRDFPKGTTDTLGIYVQDEITGLMDNRLSLIPAIRYDRRELEPQVDSLFQSTLTANNRTVEDKKESRFSPKFGAIWKLDPVWSLYSQLATGFRAPNYNEVNGSFRNAVQQYAISPNTNLKPETSVGLELGTRWQAADVRGQVSVYDNHYQDFIENIALTCPADPRCISGVANTFINDNISRVRIYGAEARSQWDFASGWRLDGAIAYTHGQNESDHQPLNSIEPARLSIGLQRDMGEWGAEARVRSARAVSRVDETNGDHYKPAGYSVVNLAAWWKPFKDAQLDVALNNLLDKKYYLWSDIRQADAINPVGVDFYSQPGRNLSASFSYQF